MKKIKVLTALACSLAVFFSVTCIANAETVYDYDADATLKYAKQHCEDTKEPGASKADCVEFARTCVKNGGVPQDSSRVFKNGTGYTPEDYISYMVDNGYAELYKLTKRTHTDYYGKKYQYVHQDDNEGIISPGDIIVYKCTNEKCDKEYYHLSICAPADESGTYAGYYRYYAHNKSVNNKILCTVKCFSCKTEEDLYVLHITSKENGYEKYTEKTAATAKCKDYNTIKISWDAVDEATGYNVFYKMTKNSFYKKLTTATGTSTEFTVPEDYYAAPIYFAVRPCEDVDGKKHVGALSSWASAYTVANKPTNVKLSLTDYRSVKVSWTKAKGATGYIVEYKPEGSSKWSYLCETTKSSATKKKLTTGKKYTFRITPYTTSAKYTGQRKSTKSATSSVYTLKTLSKPTVKRTSSTKVKIGWKNIAGETGYQISKSTSKTKTGTITTVASSTAKTKTLSVKKGKHYYYKVRAYKVVNGKKVCGPWSAVKYF